MSHFLDNLLKFFVNMKSFSNPYSSCDSRPVFELHARFEKVVIIPLYKFFVVIEILGCIFVHTAILQARPSKIIKIKFLDGFKAIFTSAMVYPSLKS